jgi:hypothetical protein
MGGHPVDSPEADDFHVPGDRPATALLDDFREQAETSMAVVRDLPLHTQPAWWPEGAWGGWRLDNLHEVILHLIVETACHAGHLDAARELIDKRTWDYPSGRLSAPIPIPAS